MNHINNKNHSSSQSHTNIQLTNNRSVISDSIGSIINFNIEKLNYIKEISTKLIYAGENKEEQIIIPIPVLEDIFEKTGVRIHEYIGDFRLKGKILELLGLEKNYGFVRHDSTSAIIMLNINHIPKEGERVRRYYGLSEKNINFIIEKILKLTNKEERMNLVYEITSKIDFPNLGNENISLYFQSGNYINFVFEIVKKEITIISGGNIDKEICIGITGFIVREYFNLELDSKKTFFKKIESHIETPKNKLDPIIIPTENLIDISNIQNYVVNPLFKKKLRYFLKLEQNYGLVFDKIKSNIIMLNIASENEQPKRFNGLDVPKLKYILQNILKLKEKEDIIIFLNDVISSIDLAKISNVKLSDIFNSGNYINFISDIITKEVFSLGKGNIDKEISIGVTGFLFREHFEFVNSRIAYLLINRLSSSTGVYRNNIYIVNETLESNIRKTVLNLRTLFSKNMKALINDMDINEFRKTFDNSIFNDFSLSIKNQFSSIGIKELDDTIIRGLFIHLVESGDIRNPMVNFTDIIFDEIGTKKDKLSRLFGFFDFNIQQLGLEKHKYLSFSFKDIEIESSTYSVKKVFDEIEKKFTELNTLNSTLDNLNQPIVKIKTSLNLNKTKINGIKSKLLELKGKKEDLENEINILKVNMPSGLIGNFKKQGVINTITNKEIEIETLNNEIEGYNAEIRRLENERTRLDENLNIYNGDEELQNLEKQKGFLETKISRIKEDFANTLFYGIIEI